MDYENNISTMIDVARSFFEKKYYGFSISMYNTLEEYMKALKPTLVSTDQSNIENLQLLVHDERKLVEERSLFLLYNGKEYDTVYPPYQVPLNTVTEDSPTPQNDIEANNDKNSSNSTDNKDKEDHPGLQSSIYSIYKKGVETTKEMDKQLRISSTIKSIDKMFHISESVQKNIQKAREKADFEASKNKLIEIQRNQANNIRTIYNMSKHHKTITPTSYTTTNLRDTRLKKIVEDKSNTSFLTHSYNSLSSTVSSSSSLYPNGQQPMSPQDDTTQYSSNTGVTNIQNNSQSYSPVLPQKPTSFDNITIQPPPIPPKPIHLNTLSNTVNNNIFPSLSSILSLNNLYSSQSSSSSSSSSQSNGIPQLNNKYSKPLPSIPLSPFSSISSNPSYSSSSTSSHQLSSSTNQIPNLFPSISLTSIHSPPSTLPLSPISTPHSLKTSNLPEHSISNSTNLLNYSVVDHIHYPKPSSSNTINQVHYTQPVSIANETTNSITPLYEESIESRSKQSKPDSVIDSQVSNSNNNKNIQLFNDNNKINDNNKNIQLFNDNNKINDNNKNIQLTNNNNIINDNNKNIRLTNDNNKINDNNKNIQLNSNNNIINDNNKNIQLTNNNNKINDNNNNDDNNDDEIPIVVNKDQIINNIPENNSENPFASSSKDTISPPSFNAISIYSNEELNSIQEERESSDSIPFIIPIASSIATNLKPVDIVSDSLNNDNNSYLSNNNTSQSILQTQNSTISSPYSNNNTNGNNTAYSMPNNTNDNNNTINSNNNIIHNVDPINSTNTVLHVSPSSNNNPISVNQEEIDDIYVPINVVPVHSPVYYIPTEPIPLNINHKNI
ncbi:hypothetical protein WA158_005067 [Blastocystis sp. Blastoise]